MSDRYLRIVLTVIAVELAWIGLRDVLPAPVTAQAQAAPARVVITGVSLPNRTQFLPVGIVGGGQNTTTPPGLTLSALAARVEPGDRAVRVELPGNVNARIVEPVRIDTSRPLDVKSVPAEGSARPGL